MTWPAGVCTTCPVAKDHPLHQHGRFRMRDGTRTTVYNLRNPPGFCSGCRIDVSDVGKHYLEWDGPYHLVIVHPGALGQSMPDGVRDELAWLHHCGTWNIQAKEDQRS